MRSLTCSPVTVKALAASFMLVDAPAPALVGAFGAAFGVGIQR